MRCLVFLCSAICVLAISACGPSVGNGDDDDTTCQNRCTSFGWEQCHPDGTFDPPVRCASNQVCSEDLGCSVCAPNIPYCGAPDQVWTCNADGSGGTLTTQCPQGEVCGDGVCTTPCNRALGEPSNVGCDFWAADLDNEAAETLIGVNDAAAQQYAIVVANNNDYDVSIQVFKNAGRVGGTLDEQLVLQATAPARSAKQLDLPMREVDGTMGQNGTYARYSGSGTFVSPHGYHLITSGPVVAYQFNPIVQQFSNDASILIPIQALGKHYYVWGWPTANPCGPPAGMFPGFDASIPDHTAITIVGVEDNTQVQVTATHPIKATEGDSGFSIPATPAGQPFTFTINRYDVVNLETDQPVVPIQECFNYLDRDGDLMGSLVTANRKIAVFTSLERGIGDGGAMPPDPPNWDGESCCTDHLEEQLLPTVALGREYAVSRSPVRSTNPSYREPDMYRVLASEDGVQITTNLPAPFDAFTLDAGEFKAFYADRGFTLSATGAVTLGQVLVSQHRVPDGFIGDPSLVIFPAAEQHRKDYVFLVPSTFRDNYFVLAKPVAGTFTVDGRPLGEFAGCQVEPIGVVQTIAYEQVTCKIAEGQHTVEGSDPFGVTVYGYYNVGSYAFAGGSDLKIINPIGKPKAPRTKRAR
ncbi:MAG: IgGFc-binding protein [Kofleriaceae bacterium]